MFLTKRLLTSLTDRPNYGRGHSLAQDLAGELYYARLWLFCVWRDKIVLEQRELAFQAQGYRAAPLVEPTNLVDMSHHTALLGLFFLMVTDLF
jgi:hypothetical protein